MERESPGSETVKGDNRLARHSRRLNRDSDHFFFGRLHGARGFLLEPLGFEMRDQGLDQTLQPSIHDLG